MNSQPVVTCSICLEAPQAPVFVALCGHSFCYVCIQRWAATAIYYTCPICWQPIVVIRLLTLENPAVPHQRVRRQSLQRANNRRNRLRSLIEVRLDLAWLQRIRDEEPGSGDHAGRQPLPQYRV